jgi:cell wall assembly regulator SMI1
MTYNKPDYHLSANDLAMLETELDFSFPESVRRLYLATNGGYPDPYVITTDALDTVVSEFLPLKSDRGTGTAMSAYRRLVLEKRLCPVQFFPFAVDGGGDYFFVDCSDPLGRIYFFRGDYALDLPEEALLDLGINFDEFWSSLKSE